MNKWTKPKEFHIHKNQTSNKPYTPLTETHRTDENSEREMKEKRILIFLKPGKWGSFWEEHWPESRSSHGRWMNCPSKDSRWMVLLPHETESCFSSLLPSPTQKSLFGAKLVCVSCSLFSSLFLLLVCYFSCLGIGKTFQFWVLALKEIDW